MVGIRAKRASPADYGVSTSCPRVRQDGHGYAGCRTATAVARPGQAPVHRPPQGALGPDGRAHSGPDAHAIRTSRPTSPPEIACSWSTPGPGGRPAAVRSASPRRWALGRAIHTRAAMNACMSIRMGSSRHAVNTSRLARRRDPSRRHSRQPHAHTVATINNGSVDPGGDNRQPRSGAGPGSAPLGPDRRWCARA